MRGHSLVSLVKASDAPAYRGNILLRMGGDSSRLAPVKAPPCYEGIDGILSFEILRRSKSPRLSPPPGGNFFREQEENSPASAPPIPGWGGRGNKMIGA